MTSKIKTTFQIIKLIKNFPTYFLDYLGLLKRRNIIYRFRNGIKYILRTGTTDRFIINEVWIHKSYNPLGFQIKKEDLVIDIGAHIGIFSILASKYASKGNVYSFEALNENFNLLSKNKELNGLKNLKIFNKAVSNKTGKRNLFISSEINKGSNSLYDKGKEGKKISIETVSFEAFIKKEKIKKIDFLKMDCEGSEYEILFNLSNKSLKKIKKISMEYHNMSEKNNGKKLKEFLEKKGYAVRILSEARKGTIYAKLR